MKPELRSVTKRFSAKHAHKEPPTNDTFAEGETLIVYENDGAHATFVRPDDKEKAQPFITAAKNIEDRTTLAPSPR